MTSRATAAPPEGQVLAVDIGGTKVAAAVVSADGRVLVARRVDTPPGETADAESVWESVAGVVGSVLADVDGVTGVGVGCGGPMTWPAAEVSPLNIPSWRGFPLRERLADLLPGLPVRVHNDAVCMAVGEHWRGAGQGATSMLGMVVSTGVGGGLVLGDRLVDGPTGNAGHVGHVVVEPAGPACSCGGQGCLEAVASGPRLAGWAREQGWRSGAGGSARDLAADARGGDEVAVRAFERAGRAIGVALASTTHLVDLDLVVVGGGVSQAGDLLFGPLEESLRRHARMGFATRVAVLPAALGQEAGIVGAAALVAAGSRYWSG